MNSVTAYSMRVRACVRVCEACAIASLKTARKDNENLTRKHLRGKVKCSVLNPVPLPRVIR